MVPGVIKRVAFWYTFVYLFFFNLSNTSPLSYIPYVGGALLTAYEELRKKSIPVLGKALGLEVVVQRTGSGDTMLDWLTLLAIVCVSAALAPALVWLTRKKPLPVALFLFWVRLCLGNILIGYGACKLIPVQMGPPGMHRLLQPLGEMSPMGLVWTFMGFSPFYESFTGLVELSAGLLLFHPRTRLLGAMIGMVAAVQVFLINMCFDVPVKIYSFHIVVMAAVLMLPDAPRLLNFLLMNRTVEPAPEYYLSSKPRLETLLQVWFGLGIATLAVAMNYQYLQKSKNWVTHKGVWDLEGSPLGWQRVILDYPGKMTVIKADGSKEFHQIEWFEQGLRVLTEGMTLSVYAPDDNTLDLGVARGRRYDDFPLLQRGFHWVQEKPFNR